MKKQIVSSLAVVGLAAISIGLGSAVKADSLTTVTTTTTETPMSTHYYRRTVTPVMVRPTVVEKKVTITKSAVVKRSCSSHHTAYVHHPRHVALHAPAHPRLIASSTTTKTITRTIDRPVVVEKVVTKPVYINHYVDRPVYTDRVVEKPIVIEKPVVLNRAYVQEAPVLVKEKVTHHSDHDTIQIKRYY